MRRILTYLIYMACMLLMVCGCQFRDITYDYHPFCEVDLEVDWSRHAETPSGMTAMFYPADGGRPVVHITHDVEKTKVSLREGVYNVILFSYSQSEYGSIGFRGMDRYETAEIYVTEASSKGWYSKAEGEKVAAEPELIGVATIEGFEVTEEMIHIQRAEAKAEEAGAKAKSTDGGSDTKIPTKAFISLSPKNIIANGTIKIHIDGIHNLRSTRGTIVGMSEGFIPSEFMTTDSHVTHVLDRWSVILDEDNNNNGYIETAYSTFGLPQMQISRAEGRSNSLRGIPLSKAARSDAWLDARLNISLLLVDNQTVVNVSYKVGEHITIIEETHEIVLELEIEEARPDPDDPDGTMIPVDPDDPGTPGGPDDPGTDSGTLVLPDVKPEESPGGGGFDVSIDSWGEKVEIDVIL